ncbi:unnamed protein product [Lepeophtheirus salmonis]|uniref:(salmon louse) hypothetical protein n=1 Tax=Lepeophtheirus salmonis TaxID=72036 RepID=A0A7R8HC05_LEPSM|nr:unnamed protein product [Lepeophtheirus salmonis]CAF2980693.1 unnamed protein product [Lepeophtheirus salmonis]
MSCPRHYHPTLSATYEAHEGVYPSAPPKYNYNYEVADSYKGLNFGQNEERDNSATLGEYHVQLPDGRRQVVKYAIKDAYSGYLAEVSYEGEAHYDPPSKYTTYKAVVPTETIKAPAPKTNTYKPTPKPIVYKPLSGQSNPVPPPPASSIKTIVYEPLPNSGPSKTDVLLPSAPVADNNIVFSEPLPPPSFSSQSVPSKTIVYKPIPPVPANNVVFNKPLPPPSAQSPLTTSLFLLMDHQNQHLLLSPTSGEIYYKPLPPVSAKSSSPIIVNNNGPSSPVQDFSQSAPVQVFDSSTSSSSLSSYTPKPVVIVSSTSTPFVSTTPLPFSSSTNNYSS